MDNTKNNISFFFEEKEKDIVDINNIQNKIIIDDYNDNNDNNDDHIQQMIYELELDSLSKINNYETDMTYFINKSFYNNDEIYYNETYNIKDLLKICNYYGIEKNIKLSKCKKQDIISTIIYFESLLENFELVQKRNKMWAYMTELYNDSKMKKYIIWS